MNFAILFKAFDTVMVIREAAKRIKGEVPPPESGLATTAPAGLSGQIEARLTNVVIAALKEAFDRDHARLELERAHLEEQRRRAEEATRLEVRRHAADRELGRLRLLTGAAMVGWIVSVMLLVTRNGQMTAASIAVLAAGSLLLLGSLGAAFTVQGRISASLSDGDRPLSPGTGGAATLWLLLAGLALSA